MPVAMRSRVPPSLFDKETLSFVAASAHMPISSAAFAMLWPRTF